MTAETLTAEPMAVEAESFSDFLAAIGEPEQAPFGIDSMDRLAWFGNKRAGYAAEVARIQANAAAMIAEVEKRARKFDDRFMGEAEAFARQMLQATGAKTKTLKTLGGAFSFRTVNGGARVADKDALLRWAEGAAPELVEIKTSYAIPADRVKAYVETETARNGGDIMAALPPGVEYVPTRESFSHKAEA